MMHLNSPSDVNKKVLDSPPESKSENDESSDILTRQVPPNHGQPGQNNQPTILPNNQTPMGPGNMGPGGMTQPPMGPGGMGPGGMPQSQMMGPGGMVQPGMYGPGGMPQPGPYGPGGMPQPGMFRPGPYQPRPPGPGGPGSPPYGPGGMMQMPGHPGPGGPQNGAPSFNQQAPRMQNIQAGDGSGGTYASTQKCWGQCTSWLGTWIPCCCCCPNPYQTVPEGFSGIIMRFDKFHKILGPGMHYLLPEVDRLILVDKREKIVNLGRQAVVSRDNTSFQVDAVLYYRVVNTYKSKFGVMNLQMALQELSITTLRNAVGKMTVQQLLELKDQFAEQIEKEIAGIADGWGAKIHRVLIQDVHLPHEFRASFSTSAIAKKISEAQVIISKAEVEVARLMREAADSLSTDAAFQIRYIDALESITNSNNPKMIFFPASYDDLGTANDGLVSNMSDEMDKLLKKK